MPFQLTFHFPPLALLQKHSVRVLLKNRKWKMIEKNMINKEMVIDILMLILLTVVPILIALI